MNVVALLVADIHLSEKSPVARSVESDWFAAMKRPLDELRSLQEKYNAPILCSGDVFDKWRSSPELINFAITNLPKMHAVPGQHDLPHHRYEDVRKSAYWTLVETGNIENLIPLVHGGPFCGHSIGDKGSVVVFASPWGCEVTPISVNGNNTLPPVAVALIHKFIYTKSTGYTGAPKTERVSGYREQLRGYDVAVFGDNHHGFSAKSGDCVVYNCGTLFRRSISEVDYRPRVGLLHDDGTVEKHYLDTLEDKWITEKEVLADTIDVEEFLASLGDLQVDSLDFREAVCRRLDVDDVVDPVREVVMEIFEG